MRRTLLIALTTGVSLLGVTGAAQAIVVDMNALGQATVPFNSSSQSGYAGVSLVPGTCGDLLSNPTCAVLSGVGIPTVTSGAPCSDPALTSDLALPNTGICSHGGSVMGKNETFALTWDADRSHWSVTRNYIEQFLSDVAGASGSLASPYAVTPQYSDSSGKAQNSSKFGGGCVDYGSVGGSTCEFSAASGTGHDFPANGCTPAGDSFTAINIVSTNTICLTDAQLQSYLASMIGQVGLLGRTQPGYTPLVTLLLPPGVVACLDATSKLCAANGSLTPPVPTVSASTTTGTVPPGSYDVEITYNTSSGEGLPSASTNVPLSGNGSITIDSPPSATGATGWYAYVKAAGASSYIRVAGPLAIGTSSTMSSLPASGAQPPLKSAFCSYHSQVSVGGTEVAYLVQPWTAGTGCDEPGLSAPPDPLNDPVGFAKNVGLRLASPLSQAHIASIVNPGLNGWFALNGSEIYDNGFNGYACHPLGPQYDSVTLSGDSYVLQREFNNAGVIESDPNTYFGCAPGVLLGPSFVVPSAVDQGDEVVFDGSTTVSTLIVPGANYAWDFGDGNKATGPSVTHSYTSGGTYTVTLTVTDRGGNRQSLSQTIEVLGPNGLPVPPATSGGSAGGSGPGPGGGPGQGGSVPAALLLHARLQLLPEALHAVTHRGVAMLLTANEPADGYATVTISRSLARRLGLKLGSKPFVVVGRGTLSGIKTGTAQLRLHLPGQVAAKLARLHRATLTIRLVLIAPGGDHVALDAAGRY
jgi:hypothetical protein